ncbi:MAG: OadG family protein [Chloroflexi bacterium]|jgi:Na+-transporting methylmalonyl-CoA/oxaloacetate decarboxylase gamma subunit|nr:OadG family protein [Chloroflexota bacterium]
MADVDWAEAFEIGGLGFGLVIVVLMILALVMWLMGLLLKRYTSEEETEAESKGD